jgi:8-oxo-dGTP diphosphatase
MALSEFTVAGALVETDDGLLLVRNQRRGGVTDWSTPGGVIDASDASLLEGLTREVAEETGLRVTEWEGPLYEVRAVAVEMGWSMRCEVHRALVFDGELTVDDPDGIVVEARFAPIVDCHEFLALGSPWVREPLVDWLEHRWGPLDARAYSYDVRGARREELRAVRVDQP